MTKDFCDICKIDVTDKETAVRVRSFYGYEPCLYCFKCFQNKKNWPIIHKFKFSDD